MKNTRIYILTIMAIECMSATCCPVTINYAVNQESIHKVSYDSIDITLSSKYVSHPYDKWGMDISTIFHNSSSKPVLVYLNNIEVNMNNYILSNKSITINDSQYIDLNIDTTIKSITINPYDKYALKYYLAGSPDMTLKKVARNNSILNAVITINGIDNKEIKTKPFILTLEPYPSKR